MFAFLMMFLCVILHTMWSGESLQLLCILPFVMLCLFVKHRLAVCILLGMLVSAISCQVYECHRVECAFTSRVRTE